MTRTPRQRPGEDLRPVTVLVTAQIRHWLEELAQNEQRSLSFVVRDILEAAYRKAAP